MAIISAILKVFLTIVLTIATVFAPSELKGGNCIKRPC